MQKGSRKEHHESPTGDLAETVSDMISGEGVGVVERTAALGNSRSQSLT